MPPLPVGSFLVPAQEGGRHQTAGNQERQGGERQRRGEAPGVRERGGRRAAVAVGLGLGEAVGEGLGLGDGLAVGEDWAKATGLETGSRSIAESSPRLGQRFARYAVVCSVVLIEPVGVARVLRRRRAWASSW